MADCPTCQVEPDCHYPFKPCDCVHQRKFWSAQRRAVYDRQKELATQDIPTESREGD